MQTYQLGMVGLGVMGRNLALNLLEKGFSVLGYNRKEDAALLDTFRAQAKELSGQAAAVTSLAELCGQLERPRRILLLIPAGAPVDALLKELLAFLEPGDVVADAGNSYFKDTIRRERSCRTLGVHFVGMGVSGGEEGARHGPAIMVGGAKEAYPLLAPFLERAAAQVEGAACCAWIGENGAGHFVKMVHNGIEYGDMQLICETYYLMKRLTKLSAAEMGTLFGQWNRGRLDSYLIEITADILSRADAQTGRPMVDVILGAAQNKGTGKWTSQESLDLGVPLPTVTEAVFARYLSALVEERQAASRVLHGPQDTANVNAPELLDDLQNALYAAKLCSYAQGFAMLREAAHTHDWALDYSAIAKLFRGGCIIRARLLQSISAAFEANPQLANLMLAPGFSEALEDCGPGWRRVVRTAVQHGVAVPGLCASLAYFDSYRDPQGPLALLQAQRDYFGAHTFLRTDKPGVFHHDWQK